MAAAATKPIILERMTKRFIRQVPIPFLPAGAVVRRVAPIIGRRRIDTFVKVEIIRKAAADFAACDS
jgi:hypothetical protein